MSTSHGKFVWYELMTSDLPAAEAFYAKVVGWEVKDAGMPGMRYSIAATSAEVGSGVAGMMTLPAEAAASGARPGWCGYVAVDDVDAYAAHVKEAGGSVHHAPEDIPGVGRFAVVADTGGAAFALFKGNSEAPPAAPAGTPGQIGWHELHAGEGAREFAFYASLFGWTKAEAMDMGPMGIYQIFAAADVPIGGMMTKTPETPMPAWLYYINVDSITAAAARVTEHGGKVLMAPHEVPGGSWILNAMDPQGAMFALVGPKG